MKKILIIDDQPCVAKLIQEELINEGYRIQITGDVQLAKKYIKFFKPNLVLLDLFLDGPEGWDLLPNIKRRHPNLPVIIVTTYDSFMDDSRLSQADGYVVKSMDFTELKQKVAVIFQPQIASPIQPKPQRVFYKLAPA